MWRTRSSCTIKPMETIRPQEEQRSALAILVDSVIAVSLMVLVWLQLALPRFRLSGGPPIRRPEGVPFGRPLSVFVRRADPPPAAYVLVAVCFLPLALRRRYPLSVLAVTTVASAAYSLLPFPPALTFFAVLAALYTVGTRYSREKLALAAIAVAAVTLPASLPEFGTTLWVAEFVRITALLAAAALLGDATRNRRAYIAEVEQRAVQAERTRDEEALRRVDEERLRIARELHDIVAHSLSIVAVQSGMAKHVIRKDPKEAAKAIENISKTSRSALKELRSVIDVLRGAGEGAQAPLTPAPSLSHLDTLTHPLEQAGLEVDLRIEVDLSELPSLVDASAYRIVQEALTNVIRHAEASRVDVKVGLEEDNLRVTVSDNGRGVPEGAKEGHGIPGMRERAIALGGSFEAGPLRGGGYEVRVRLPLKAASR